MIVKIVSYFMLGFCFLAFFLAIIGVHHVSTGDEYYKFLSTVSERFNSWSIQIPNVPSINKISGGTYDSSGLILGVLIKIANFFVSIVNALISIVNVFVLILNIVIQLIQFVCTLLYSFKDFINRLKDLNLARTIV